MVVVLLALSALTGLSAAQINSLSGWHVENGGEWAVDNSTFWVTSPTDSSSYYGWTFLVNNTTLPNDYAIYVRLKIVDGGEAGVVICPDLDHRLDVIVSQYTGESCNGHIQIVRRYPGGKQYINPGFGPESQPGTWYYIHIIKRGTLFTFYAGTDNKTGETVQYTISDSALLSNVHLAFLGREANDAAYLEGVEGNELDQRGFHRLVFAPNHWYKIVPWQGEGYSYIMFTNDYNTKPWEQCSMTVYAYYLNEDFEIVDSVSGPEVYGELYPMLQNGKILLPGHDGSVAWFGTFDPETGQFSGQDVSGSKYLTDVIYDKATDQYFLMPARTSEFFYKCAGGDILNPSNWEKVYLPSELSPSSNEEMRFTIFKHYIYFVKPITLDGDVIDATGYVFRYDILDGTFQTIATFENSTFSYIRSDYNTVAYATVHYDADNGTATADFCVSHDGTNFTKIFTATIDASQYDYEKHAYILPLFNSQYYYIEAVGDGNQGKYYVIGEDGTVYYNATVEDAAHSTIADPIVERNRLLEGAEKIMGEFYPPNGWNNNSYLQAMTFEELPIDVSTEPNGGEAVQVGPDTVIYAIEPYNGTLGMFFMRFTENATVYVNASVPYRVGTIVALHGNYPIIEDNAGEITILEPDDGDWVAGTFTVSWEPVDGADHYVVLLDGSELGSTTDTTYSVTATDGSHAVMVRAYDSSDNLIAEGSVDVNVDATAPTVSITSPADGAVLDPGTVTVTWDASDSGSGISTIKVYLDGGLEATLGPGNASYDLDLSAGDHTIEVKVYDAVGNAGSDAVSVTVSGEISVTITSPNEGDFVATSDVTVTWTYSGAVDHFGVSVDGGSEQDVGTSTSVTLTLDDGSHTVTVTAHGSSTSASDTVTFTVDATPPSLSASAPAYATGDYEVTWTCAEDNLDHYEVSVDGGAWQNVGTSTSYAVTDPTEGSHTVAVKAVDKAGNEATQTVTTVVDATPPSLTITSPEDDSVIVGHSVTLEWSVSDSGSGIDYVGYRVGTGAWTEVTGATQVVLTLDDGYYTVTMKAVDNAGNEVYRAVSFTVVDPIQLTITSPEENATLEPGNITVTWEVNGTVDHFAVRLDDGPWIDVGNATSWTFTDVTEGEHTVYVRAYENETAYVEESVTFTIASSGGTGGSWWDNWDTDNVNTWIKDHWVWLLVLLVFLFLVLGVRRR